jgi:PAS domain S-box-containing protein
VSLTEAKWAEEALHEREVRLHAIVDTASDGISIIDRAGRLVEINPAGLMFMECEKAGEAIGQPVYSYVAAEYLDTYRAFHERILGGETGTLEFEIRGRKGARRWIESRSVPWRNPANGQIMRFAICRDITERRRSQEQIQYLAYHDTLTGLPNRALLLDRLERALAQAERYNQLMALLYLDLDHFKLINDALGHGVGDRLLKEVAARLSSALREEDTVVRLGGDEFLINLAPDLRSPRCHPGGREGDGGLVPHLCHPGPRTARDGKHRDQRLSQRWEGQGNPDEARRCRPLPGQGGGPQHLSVLQSGDECPDPGAVGPGKCSASGA